LRGDNHARRLAAITAVAAKSTGQGGLQESPGYASLGISEHVHLVGRQVRNLIK
jgi:hypothetical protein